MYWLLIEEFLLDFEGHANMKFDTALFSFFHDGEAPEEKRMNGNTFNNSSFQVSSAF